MTAYPSEGRLDGDAVRPVRPYALSGGRTRPGMELDLMSMIAATGAGTGSPLEPEHLHVLTLCRQPVAVAEVAALMRLPAVAAKVLLSDLAAWGAVRVVPPLTATQATSPDVLRRILYGLRQL